MDDTSSHCETVYAVTTTPFGNSMLDTGETVMYEFYTMEEAQKWIEKGRPDDVRLVRRADLQPHERDAIDAVLK